MHEANMFAAPIKLNLLVHIENKLISVKLLSVILAIKVIKMGSLTIK